MKLESRRPGKGDGSDVLWAGNNRGHSTEQRQRQRIAGTLSLRTMWEATS